MFTSSRRESLEPEYQPGSASKPLRSLDRAMALLCARSIPLTLVNVYCVNFLIPLCLPPLLSNPAANVAFLFPAESKKPAVELLLQSSSHKQVPTPGDDARQHGTKYALQEQGSGSRSDLVPFPQVA